MMKKIINLLFFLLIIVLFLSPKLSVVYSQETCEIYPESFPYGFQGEIEIRASGIEKGKKYGLILPTDMGYLEVTAIDDQLIKANLLHDNSLQRSGEIEVRRANIGRALICTVNIVVEARPPRAPSAPPCDICKCDTTTEPPRRTENCPDCNEECENCIRPGGTYEKGGSWTVFGCINTGTPSDFVAWVLSFAIKIGGGIAVLLIIIGGIQVLTSAGNPDKVKAGKDIITAAISGLLLIIFSLFLLQLIGAKILKIPGFGQ